MASIPAPAQQRQGLSGAERRAAPRIASADGWHLRFYGDGLTVMTGPQCNTLQKRGGDQPIRGEGFATQVWALGKNGWQISSFHATRLPNL